MAKKTVEKDGPQKLQLNLINPKGLIEFIGKFKSIDSNLLLAIDTEKIEVRSYTPTAVAVKIGEINFENVFALPEGEEIPPKFKIGIYNVAKFIKIFSYVDEDNILLNITYSQEKNGDNYGIKIDVKTATLQKVIPGAKQSMFKSMTDDQVERAFDIEEAFYSIEFGKPILDKIRNLLSVESSHYFTIISKKDAIYFTGSEFKLKYSGELDILKEEDFELPLASDVFKYADNENYTLYAKETGALLMSKDSNIKIGLAAIEDPSSLDDVTED